MDNREAVNWLINISADIGKVEHSDLWHYERALTEIKDMLESIQPVVTDTNVGDTISRQAAIDALDCINGTEEVLRSLPPAQPETVKCKDCKYNVSSHKCLHPESFFLVPDDNFYCGYAERRTDGQG